MSDEAPRLALARAPVREQPHLRDYLQVLRRHWFAMAAVLLLVAVGAAVYVTSEAPIYEARTRLIVEPVLPVAGTPAQPPEASGVLQEDLETHYQLLQSRALARNTINELGVWDRFSPARTAPAGAIPAAKQALKDALRATAAWLGVGATPATPQTSEPDTEERAQARAVTAFVSRLKVAPVQDSRLIEVSFRDGDPALAARAVNALAKTYISDTLTSKASVVRETSELMAEQLKEQRKQVAAAEAALQNYRERNDALSIESGQNIVAQKLADLNGAVTKAKTERVQRESVYRQVAAAGNDPRGLDSVPAVVSNIFIQQQRAELATLQREQAQLAERLGDRHPEMAKAKLAVQAAESRLRSAVDEVVQSLRRDYDAALAQEETLTAALSQQKGVAQSTNRKGITYAVLQREVESSKEVYDSLLQRARLTAVSNEAKTSNVRIVDTATRPDLPLGPDKTQVAVVALLAGVFLAVSAAFFLDYLDNRLRTPQAVEAHLRLMPLGLIPRQPRRRRVGGRLIDYRTTSPLVEAFRGLRTNVMFSLPEGAHSIVVTSASPGEGKTLVAANLAVCIAQTGQRVVIIDADLRRPHMHRLFGLAVAPGLSNLVEGGARLEDAVRPTGTPKLRLITAGDATSSPAELVGSKEFSTLLTHLQRNFDVVVVDTPPVMAVADASILAHQTSGVLFVVGADSTTRHAAQAALDQLERARGRFLGAVLNRTDARLHRYYHASYFGRARERVAAGVTH